MRFPGKNIHPVDGVPMFMHSAIPLIQSKKVDRVIICTDSSEVWNIWHDAYGSGGIVWRYPASSINDEPLIKVLNYAYKSQSNRYPYIVTIMANCPGHTVDNVDRAIQLAMSKGLKEVRSYNHEGEESGLMVFREDVVIDGFCSSYMGAIPADVKEIHYRSDLG